jgi:hypothetical protein
VYAYLRRLLTGSVECKRTKLMFVGLGGAGKTRYHNFLLIKFLFSMVFFFFLKFQIQNDATCYDLFHLFIIVGVAVVMIIW